MRLPLLVLLLLLLAPSAEAQGALTEAFIVPVQAVYPLALEVAAERGVLAEASEPSGGSAEALRPLALRFGEASGVATLRPLRGGTVLEVSLGPGAGASEVREAEAYVAAVRARVHALDPVAFGARLPAQPFRPSWWPRDPAGQALATAGVGCVAMGALFAVAPRTEGFRLRALGAGCLFGFGLGASIARSPF